MLNILGLQVKGLQSCQLSNFENDTTPGQIERWPKIAHNVGGMDEVADFFLENSNFDS